MGCEAATQEYTPKIILERLNKFRKEGKFCDVRILAGDSEFLAHKVILAAFSPHLEELFSKGYPGPQHFVLLLDCVDASLVDILLEYVYTTEIEFSESNVSGLLHLAKFFKAAPLFENCCRYMENNVNALNCVTYYQLSVTYLRQSLKEKCLDCIFDNISLVSQDMEFLQLPTDLLRNILAHRELTPDVEEAALRWCHSKGPGRSHELVEIFSKLNLAITDSARINTPSENWVICEDEF